jgi:K+-transporting ATPase ATPase C chain
MKYMNIAQDIKQALFMFLAFTLITGLVYPLLITGIVQTIAPEKAEGSLIIADGKVVGSELIGQNFSDPGYFQGRPSATGYAANSSGASNYGPSSKSLIQLTARRIEHLQHMNNLSQNETVPGELVLASASGLDPHISIKGALMQVERIAEKRSLPQSEIKLLVYQHIEPAQFGIMGQSRVNVLLLNRDLELLAETR